MKIKKVVIMMLTAVLMLSQPVWAAEIEFSDGEYDAASVEISFGEEVFTEPENVETVTENSGETPEEMVVYNGIIYEYQDWDKCYKVTGYTDELIGKEDIVIEEFIGEIKVNRLYEDCLVGLEGVKTISIPGSIKNFSDFMEDYEGITIKCPLNSSVDGWAKKEGIICDNSTYPPERIVKDGACYLLRRPSRNLKNYVAVYGFPKEMVETVQYESELFGIPVTELATLDYFSEIVDSFRPEVLNVKNFYIANGILRVDDDEFAPYPCLDWTGNDEDCFSYENLETITFEDGDTPLELGKNLFEGCKSLREVNFSSRVKELPERAFIDCPAMKSLELPVGMEKIGGAALQGLNNLETLHIPSTVTEIADDAMNGLEKLTIFGAKGSFAENYAVNHGITFVPLADDAQVPEVVTLDGNEYMYMPETDTYRLIKGMNQEFIKIPKEIDGKRVSEIGKGAFVNCSNLRSVYVEGKLNVEGGTFVNCPRLYEFYAPESAEFAVDSFERDSKVVVETIGILNSPELDEAGIFYVDAENSNISYNDQHNLRYVDYHSKMYVQDYDDSDSEVLIEKFVDIIGRRSFYGCNRVQEVVIANGPVAIETKAFSNCKNLQKVIIPATVEAISDDAFEGTDKVVIYAPKGSYALEFAKENGIAYKVSNLEKMQRPVLAYVRSSKDNNYITLKWDHIPYADGYQVYRFNSDTRKYERITTIKGGNRLYYKIYLRAGKTEYFKVRAYSDAEIYSEKYSPSSIKVTAEAIPDKVKIRTVLAKYPNKLGIYWRQREGAHGYLIYRSEKEPYKGYKKLKYITDESATKYMDTGVKKGRTYYYRMRAYRIIDGKRVYGPLSDPYKAKCK